MTTDPIAFNELCSAFVPGIPKPGGSKSFKGMSKRTGRAIIVDACKGNKDWRTTVQMFCHDLIASPAHGPLSVFVRFRMPRPKSHYRTGKHAGELKPNAPLWHDKKPDATKLWRAAEDALTGIIWTDDSVIVQQDIGKEYSERPGMWLRVYSMEPPAPSGQRQEQ